MIYHETEHGILYNGESLEVLRTLPDNSVNCCVTSPPYWGLRDYGTAEWVGGDAECDHKVGRFEYAVNEKQVSNNGSAGHQAKDICPKCGAIRKDKQLGLEKSPEEYVANMVQLFREVRRVLRQDGTLWLNLGDSYYPHNGSRGNVHNGGDTLKGRDNGYQPAPRFSDCGLKGKDLVGIPWRVAFALQADGWYLRQDIIWHKPNPMPESVTDRCTKAHEYVFLMSKSAKYYYDGDAVKEPLAETSIPRLLQDISNQHGSERAIDGGYKSNGTMKAVGDMSGRNRRSVWTVTTKPFKEAHFATFPRDLIRPMIQAGCPEQGIVLDPFMGSGTTAIEAIYQGKRYIGIELNPKYCDIAVRRTESELDQTDIFREES